MHSIARDADRGPRQDPSLHATRRLRERSPAETEKHVDDDGHLRTDKDNKALVKYLDPTERANYELHRASGVLTQGSGTEPFNTGGMSTNFSGPGFGIFAMGTDGRMYAESHKAGLFHHSSFLAGGDVAAAGELRVVDGTSPRRSSRSTSGASPSTASSSA